LRSRLPGAQAPSRIGEAVVIQNEVLRIASEARSPLVTPFMAASSCGSIADENPHLEERARLQG
jgi:hypothetical protein